MKSSETMHFPKGFLSTALLAGFAGGLAEVAWVGAYCAVTPLAGEQVMREVALAAGASGLPQAWLPAAGLGIHFALSVLVAVVLLGVATRLPMRGLPRSAILPASAMALLGIWAMNFLVVLPWLAPRFVELMPAGVTSASKILFGLAMGAVILHAESRVAPADRKGMGPMVTA